MFAAIVIGIFVVYNCLLFFISNWHILFALLLVEIIVGRVNRFLMKNCFFMLFIVVCNLLFCDFNTAILVGLRLFLAIEATYITSTMLTPQDFVDGFIILLRPLKLFQINTAELALTISIALTFVPILSREAYLVRQALKAKGFDFTFRNVLVRSQVYLLAYINSMFDRVEAVEQALRAKGYE